MAHFAILSPTFAGHIIPIASIGKRLHERGHRVSLITDQQARFIGERFELEFHALPPADWRPSPYKLPWYCPRILQLGRHLTHRHYRRDAAIRWLKEAPAMIAKLGVDALVVEHYIAAGGSVAQYLSLPFATVSAAMDLRKIPTHPPCYLNWAYSDSWMARTRNNIGYSVGHKFMAPTLGVINDWRSQHGLPSVRHTGDLFSRQAHIVQGCPEFDFPLIPEPWRHYGGCLSCDFDSRPQIDFPWSQLDGRPIVFVSLGTVSHGRNLQMLKLIARACAKLPVQVVLTRGNWLRGECMKDARKEDFAGNPIVVDFAPQLAILKRASLMVNHGGLNSVLEAIAHGVPQVICPRTADQPGVSARAVRAGVALTHPFGNLSEVKLKHTIERILYENKFRIKAQAIQNALQATGGVPGSASFIEQKLLGPLKKQGNPTKR